MREKDRDYVKSIPMMTVMKTELWYVWRLAADQSLMTFWGKKIKRQLPLAKPRLIYFLQVSRITFGITSTGRQLTKSKLKSSKLVGYLIIVLDHPQFSWQIWWIIRRSSFIFHNILPPATAGCNFLIRLVEW